jgi:SAM-dependent methyltransferase
MGKPLSGTVDGLDVTNRFVLDFAMQHGGRVLDYGCGAGRLVVSGRRNGVDMYGTDLFYGGSKTKQEAEASGLLGTVISELGSDSTIPFPDGYFDLVVNNQVMEHVEDLGAVLDEIARVLRPGGHVLSLFPSKDVWREGHIGIPFSHWFPKGNWLRFVYTWVLRSLGLGTWKEQAPTPRQWAIDKLEWIDRWTRYRPREDIFREYNRRFRNSLNEHEYIRFRLLDRSIGTRRFLAELVDRSRMVRWFGMALFRKLAFLVIVSEKPGR